MKRSMLVTGLVSAAAGATFAWGWHDQCRVNQDALEVGLNLTTCPEDTSEGEAVLRGLALVGAGSGHRRGSGDEPLHQAAGMGAADP